MFKNYYDDDDDDDDDCGDDGNDCLEYTYPFIIICCQALSVTLLKLNNL